MKLKDETLINVQPLWYLFVKVLELFDFVVVSAMHVFNATKSIVSGKNLPSLVIRKLP